MGPSGNFNNAAEEHIEAKFPKGEYFLREVPPHADPRGIGGQLELDELVAQQGWRAHFAADNALEELKVHLDDLFVPLGDLPAKESPPAHDDDVPQCAAVSAQGPLVAHNIGVDLGDRDN